MQGQTWRDNDAAFLADQMSVVESRIEQLRTRPEGTDVADSYVLDLENVHEELRVADEEIRAQQEELERLLELQRSSRWQHERLLAALPAPALLTDGAAVIRMVNPAAVELLAKRRDALIGKPFPALVAPADRSQLRRMVARVNAGDDGFRTLVTLRPPSAGPVQVEVLGHGTDRPAPLGRSLTWLLLQHAEGADEEAGPRRPVLARAFSELTQVPLQLSGKREVLAKVASICAQAFGPGVAVSVGVGGPADPQHIGSDSSLAQDLDGAQMMAGEGPSHTAWETREAVLSEDLHTDPRWPRLVDGIRDQRVGGVVSLPVRLDGKVIGSLSVYAVPGRCLGANQLRVAELMAQTVAALLHEIDERSQLEALTHQLREALESRAVIDQAKGMIMMQDRCDADTAFKKLAGISSRTNTKLRAVAQQIVDSAVEG
jgi:PAS domain-containing protein